MNRFRQKQVYKKLLNQINSANWLSEENQSLLRMLPYELREELAFQTKTMVVYFDQEVGDLRTEEEKGALFAAPPGYDLSQLNGLNVGCGDRIINEFLLPCDAHDGQWQISENEVFDSKTALKCWAHDLPFKSNSIDYLVALHILEHQPDPVEVVLHWLDIVKPGGGVGVVVPDWRYSWDARNDNHVWSHRWNPTPNLVRKLYEQHWSKVSTLEHFCSYKWKLSFNFVLRKYGDFVPFNIHDSEHILTGKQLADMGKIFHQDD